MTHALIIDDNAQNVMILAQMLTRQGATSTKITHPGDLAQQLAIPAYYDVAFVDLEMPTLDGYSVYRLLRADLRFANTPIVAYTVHLSELHATHSFGFDGFIGKPLDARKFPDQLARILRHEAVWEPT
ncbi:MAG: response regulator [Anaerolineae bacterium]|nr:response regulator [Anaerolineae bacterium]